MKGVYHNKADINKDSPVNLFDLWEMASNWLTISNTIGPYLPGDIYQEGITDLLDFKLLA